MKYLIFGDIHGNLPALEKLFKKERGNYDKAVSHGDVVDYGPWSNECVDFLNSMNNIVCLRGNHEEAFISGEYPGTNKVAQEFFKFCYVSFDRKAEIEQYKEQVNLKDYTVKHTLFGKYYYPDTDLSHENLTKNYIIGHSHYQFRTQVNENILINTGSLGQNRKFINVAEYVLYDEKSGLVELKSFEFKVEEIIDKMTSLGYPDICVNYYRNKNKRE